MVDATETGGPATRHVVTLDDADAGERIDRLLVKHLPALSRSRIKALIAAGRLRRGKAVVRSASSKGAAGQTLVLEVPPAADPVPRGQDIPLAIVHEDDALIVIDKPAGLVVHPAAGNPDRTLVNALIAHCGDSLIGVGGVRRPGIVHRLDKDTSGLIVAAKTDAAHRDLVEQFAARAIERAYDALVWGLPAPASGEIDARIGRHPRDRKRMAVVPAGGKTAVTRYRTRSVHAQGALSLIECRLLTGRTHQIRVHMSHRGHPLVGDPLYGGAGPRARTLGKTARAAVRLFRRQALHARLLGFRHPGGTARLRFESPLPEDFRDLLGIPE